MRTSSGGALTFRSTRSVRDRHPWALGSLGCRCATENSAGGGRAGGGHHGARAARRHGAPWAAGHHPRVLPLRAAHHRLTLSRGADRDQPW